MKLKYWACLTDASVVSDIPGVEEAFNLTKMVPVLTGENIDISYEGIISNHTDSEVEAKVNKTTLVYKKTGTETSLEEVCFIKYNSKTNIFEQNFTEHLDEIQNMSKTFFEELVPLLFPVSLYIKNNKPYCFEVIKALRGCPGNRYRILANIIEIATMHLEDEFEKCYKQDPEIVKNNFGSMEVKSIIKEYSSKSIPKKCKEWITNNKWLSPFRANITSLLATITEKEDGNNAIIVAKYLEDASKLMDKRSYNWSPRFTSFLSSFLWLIEFGYNSKTTLEYVIRQNFYYSYPFDFPSEEMHLLMDYANMARNVKKDFDRLPTNLRKAHNIVLSNNKMLEIDDEMRNKFMNAVNGYKNLELSITDSATSKTWVVIAPSSPEDVVKEGISLNHCVSSYVSLIANGVSKILFLRDSANPNESLYTIEVNGTMVTEAKGNYNEDVPSEISSLIHNVEKKWAKSLI